MNIGEIKKQRGLIGKYNKDEGLNPIKTTTGKTLFKTNVPLENLDMDVLAKTLEDELNNLNKIIK